MKPIKKKKKKTEGIEIDLELHSMYSETTEF